MGTEPTAQTARARPVHEIRLGAIRAAVWANETDSGTWYNVTFERSYKDGDTWKSASSFGRDDLLVLAKAADQAHTWIVGQPRDRQEPEASTVPTQPPRRMASGQPLKEARLPTQRTA